MYCCFYNILSVIATYLTVFTDYNYGTYCALSGMEISVRPYPRPLSEATYGTRTLLPGAFP